MRLYTDFGYFERCSSRFGTIISDVNLGRCHKNLGFIIIYFFNWQTEKKPVLDNKKFVYLNIITNFRDIVPNYRPKRTWTSFLKTWFFCYYVHNNFRFSTCTKHANQQRISCKILVSLKKLWICLVYFYRLRSQNICFVSLKKNLVVMPLDYTNLKFLYT